MYIYLSNTPYKYKTNKENVIIFSLEKYCVVPHVIGPYKANISSGVHRVHHPNSWNDARILWNSKQVHF